MRSQSLVLAIALAMVVAACSNKSAQSGAATKLDKWSWLTASSKYSAEASAIPKDAQVSYSIPQDDPLDVKSEGGWGGIDTYGNFLPTDKKSYSVKGGTLVSSVGAIQRKAKFGDWDIVYSDSQRTKRVGWGHCLTSGEILMPRIAFGDPPNNMHVQNSFEVATFGDAMVLIQLDPAKQHRLCFMTNEGSDVSTAHFLGTRAAVGGTVHERKSDGWYVGATRVSQ